MANAWDAYVDNLKAPDKNGIQLIQEASIWGRLPENVAPWTTKSEKFPITLEEVKVFMGNRSGFQADGPFMAGSKCMVLTDNMDDESSFCLNMKTKQDENKKSYTMVVGKTNQTFIFAKGVESAHAGSVSDKVFKMVCYLRGQNF